MAKVTPVDDNERFIRESAGDVIVYVRAKKHKFTDKK